MQNNKVKLRFDSVVWLLTMGGSASKHHVIEGSVAPGYESVKKMFEDNFKRGAEENSQGAIQKFFYQFIYFFFIIIFYFEKKTCIFSGGCRPPPPFFLARMQVFFTCSLIHTGLLVFETGYKIIHLSNVNTRELINIDQFI